MAAQLSLFPPEERPEDEHPLSAVELGPVDEMFATARRFRSSREYLNLLRFIARFPGYSAFNGLLLYLQNPEASYVSTAATWHRRFGRKLKYNARPLAILAPMAPIRFVYDLADTEGGPLSAAQLNPPAVSGGRLGDICNNTVFNGAFHGIAVREAPRERSPGPGVIALAYDSRQRFENSNLKAGDKYLVILDEGQPQDEKYAYLSLQLAHIFCGHLSIDKNAWWPDRRGTDRTRAEIEADSVAFLVCRRQGLVEPSKNFLLDYRYREREIPPISLNTVFQAFGYIGEMGRVRWKEPKKRGVMKTKAGDPGCWQTGPETEIWRCGACSRIHHSATVGWSFSLRCAPYLSI